MRAAQPECMVSVLSDASTRVHVLASPSHTAQLSKRLSDSISPSQPTGYTNHPQIFATVTYFRLFYVTTTSTFRICLWSCNSVLPRDAILARYMLSSCVRLSVCLFVCLSVTSRCCIETTGRTELVFGTKDSFHRCVIRKFAYLQKLG